ncbi:MAG: M48 family peptidase, partial [Flavobacteriales bacterium]
FFGFIGFASDLINIPFSYYDTFVIEKKYGFNNMTVRTFITDHIKSWFIAILVGAPVLALITWFYYKSGKNFWLYAWGVITLFSVFINFFYSELIVPLFNKQTPLQSGSLRSSIEEFAGKTGFKLRNIYIIDGSKRSTKANAYFSGFGPKKRIVLYDTLSSELTEEEIVAVLAHEIGHYKKKHVLINLISSVFLTGFMLFLFSLVVDSPMLSNAMASPNPSFHLGLIVFGILYSPLSLGDMGKGKCSEYAHRGLICRLFGYAAGRDKIGQLRLATCNIIKENQKENYQDTVNAINNGLSIPIFSDHYKRLAHIDFKLGNTIVPINKALQMALEEVLHYYAYRPFPTKFKRSA